MEKSYSEQMLQALENEDLVSANLAFNQALIQDEDSELHELAQYLLQIGFLEEAEQTFLHLLEKYPNNEELYLGLAEVAIENDNSDQALNFIEKVPKDSDYYVQALLLSADLYQMIGIPEVSEAKLTEAAKILPDEPLIQFALAELFFNTERFGEAATIYQILLNSVWKDNLKRLLFICAMR